MIALKYRVVATESHWEFIVERLGLLGWRHRTIRWNGDLKNPILFWAYAVGRSESYIDETFGWRVYKAFRKLRPYVAPAIQSPWKSGRVQAALPEARIAK